MSGAEDVEAIHAVVLDYVEGWFDVFLQGATDNFIGMTKGAKTDTARRSQRLLLGPWIHSNASGSPSSHWRERTARTSSSVTSPAPDGRA